MKLERGEHSIIATFPNGKTAQTAKEALLAAGINKVQVDRIGRFGVNEDAQYNNPLASQASSQTELVLRSSDADQAIVNSARVLLASDPSVSGYAVENEDAPGKSNFLLTVVTNNSQLNQALKIIKVHHGEV